MSNKRLQSGRNNRSAHQPPSESRTARHTVDGETPTRSNQKSLAKLDLKDKTKHEVDGAKKHFKDFVLKMSPRKMAKAEEGFEQTSSQPALSTEVEELCRARLSELQKEEQRLLALLGPIQLEIRKVTEALAGADRPLLPPPKLAFPKPRSSNSLTPDFESAHCRREKKSDEFVNQSCGARHRSPETSDDDLRNPFFNPFAKDDDDEGPPESGRVGERVLSL